MPPRRKLNRRSFEVESPSKRQKTQGEESSTQGEESSTPGKEFMPVDESGEIVKSYSWISKYKRLARQFDDLCWAYSIIDWLQFLHFQKHGAHIDLSIQELVDHVRPDDKQEFGYMYDPLLALKWIQDNGICLESDYPFSGKVQRGKRKQSGAFVLRIKDVICNSPDEMETLKKLMQKPILAVLKYDGETYYKLGYEKRMFGVYHLKETDYPRPDPYSTISTHYNHGITLTGWGTHDAINYYEVRDPNEKSAPNGGHYGACRPSSQKEDEIGTIERIFDARLRD